MMAAQSVHRRDQRAKARRGPAWRARDVTLALVITLVALGTVLTPGLFADIGDTVIGPVPVVPELGVSLSGLLLVVGRWGVTLLVLYTLVQVREVPFSQRLAWGVVALGVLLNFARNVYSGQPATLSFVLIQMALCWLAWRLSTRPTVWERLREAEEELKKLKGKS